MKTTQGGRILFAAMVCVSAQVMSQQTVVAQATKQKSKPAPVPLAPVGPPGAEIVVPDVSLGDGKDVEVNFSAPMVPDSMQGKAVPAAAFLEIKPSLDADLVWQSSRSATLVLKTAVPLGGSYRIGLRRDLKDASGKPVVPGPAVTANGPALAIEQHQPRWFSTAGADARLPQITIFCNDELSADVVSKLAYFRDKSSRRVAVKAESVSVGELGKFPPPFGRHGDRRGVAPESGTGTRPALPPADASALSVVRVRPASPLPPGDNWGLVVPQGLPNASNSAATIKPYVVEYGDIPVMAVANVEAEPVLDAARQIHVTFNKSAADLKPEEWSKFISVNPKPAEMSWESSGRRVTIKGEFEHGTPYTVKVMAGAPALDQTTLGAALETKVKFAAHAPHLSLPSFDAAQWIGGRGVFTLTTANLSEAQVKIKRVGPDRAVDALRSYAVYEHDPSKEDSTDFTRIPFAAMAGRTIWEKEFPSAVELDHSERVEFTWDEVGGGKRAPGMYFVSVEGDPKEEVENGKRLGSQSLVQLTDIGLAWKFSGKEALFYAFSHTTGQPMPGVTLQSYTDESDPVEKQTTGADGTARLRMEKSNWLIAQKDGDMHGVAFQKDMPQLDMWSFDLPYTENAPDNAWKEMLLFTERPVYQPGETVYLKAIQRMHSADGLAMPPAGETAKLRLFDPQRRLTLERDVKFSETGTLADTLRLPAQGLGWYQLKISFPQPGKPPGNPASDEEGEDEPNGNREITFEQQILVQEYQPNSFRIDFVNKEVQRDGDTMRVPLNASYLMGKPLSDAEVSWTSRIAQAAFAPEKWDGYRFCHARSYYVWDGREYHSLDEEEWMAPLLTGQGTVKLSQKGEAVIEAKAPVAFGVPGPKRLSVETEVTDINQQTISASWTRIEHPSEFYIGAKRGPNAVRVGEDLTMELAVVKPDGKRIDQPVQVTALVEHLAWNAVRVETAGGGSSVKNDLIFAKVSEQPVTVDPAGGAAFTFKPAVAGTHNITFTAKDAKGADVRTVVSVDVFGADDMTWQQQDGVKMELVPDKDSYVAGEVAKVVVKTPLKGTALVTVEQNKVLWQKLQPLQPGGVVEVPVDEAWAPNVFVSVTHIRGGADDQREHKMPEYRVGFCQLRVETRRHLLAINLKPSKPEYRPGEMVEVDLFAKDGTGKPLPNTEFAFWAVDEGILSLMPWEAPNAVETFHYDQSLFVHTGLSLVRLIKEDSKELEFTNKGFVIGGGGEMAAKDLGMRKNFKPVAYWNGTLKTGADGSVRVTFVAPDNLTEFRLVAVGNEGVTRFGTAEGKFKVNKPLMLEPAMPRFANAGDQVTLKAVVHNTTEKQASVKVGLTIDEHCALLTGLNGQPVNGNAQTQTLSLAPQGTRAALFTVKFTADGPAVLQWKADGGSPELADAVESKLTIGRAEPLLREVNFLSLTPGDDGKNLLAAVRPEVLEGQGEVTITLSNSRAIDGAEAVEQLLHYPYGCVEQTMSSMMPWLALRDLKKALPGINRPDADIALAIQKGVDRLLSMQTNDGGLAYWPGGEKALPWATAHGAVGLILAARAGASVPQPRLDSLLAWLSNSLRKAGDEKDAAALNDRAYAAWTLALAEKAEAGYHEVLFRQRDQLSGFGRAMLAFAIAESAGPADMAKAVLAMKDPPKSDWWLGEESVHAIRALALMKLKDPAADAEMGRLMASRSPRGDWRNTFNNSWTLLALSREAASMPPVKAGQACVLTLAGKAQEIALPGEPASQSVTFKRDAGKALPQLSAKVPDGAKFFARVEATGRGKSGEQPARNAGFSIDRTWQRVAADGSLTPAEQLRSGDLVLVSLNVNIPAPAEYLVIDDPLPATMEGVNPNFTSMVSNDRRQAVDSWTYDYTEMRRDRVLFFRDDFAGKGKFRVEYLARVVAAGDVMAPPARIEMMYDPARFGHSASQRVLTRSSADEEVAAK